MVWKTGIGRVGLLFALLLAGSTALAPSASADDVSAMGSRNVKVKTTDSNPGGVLAATITWTGPGPYNGKVDGWFEDLEADGYCVRAWVWYDGTQSLLNKDDACPKGIAQPARFTYHNKRRVLVRVCLVKDGEQKHCSPWS